MVDVWQRQGVAAGVSRTVKDLVVGSDTGFEDRGLHTLKGFEGDWQLYSVTVGGTP